jgi:cyclic beta-1,2-glucan synthetase
MTYRFGSTIYSIFVENPDGICRGIRSLELDHMPVPKDTLTLVRDGARHTVRVILGRVDAVERAAPETRTAQLVR